MSTGGRGSRGRPGCAEDLRQDFRAGGRHDEILATEKWIIDGSGGWPLIERRFALADTIIFIDLPIYLQYWWALKRQIAFPFRSRPDRPENCPLLPMTWKMMKVLWTVHRRLRPQLVELVEAELAFALSLATFVCHMWLFETYLSSRPTQPAPELGFVYPMNNHGFYVYLTAVESTGLMLLFHVGFYSLLLAFAVVPKEIMDPHPSTPKWMTYVSVRYSTDLERLPKREFWIVFCSSVLAWLAIIYFDGWSIANYAVAHGLVLQ